MRFTPLVIATASAALLAPTAAAPSATAPAAQVLAPPTLVTPGGRYERAVPLAFRAERGAVVRYTLDGTTPTRGSRLYVPGTSVRITKDTNVTAVAFRGARASVPVSQGFLIKGAEKPVARLVVMSDVHIGDYAKNTTKWASFFDTIDSVFPKPDAILSNGDMINDNGDGKGPDHKIVARIFQENLERKGMTGTQVLLSNGNHDDSLAQIRTHYPRSWFPDAGGGFYESSVNGVPLLTLNTETYNSSTEQQSWLKRRLAELTAKSPNTPVLIQGHRPAPNTVMDGQQASNPKLTADLSAFPQAVFFSGHSHLNLNDDRSVHQKDFTAVNDGSMSYVEMDHGYQAVTAEGLASRFESPTSQALFVEVYKDRTEIARVNMAADKHDIYTGGKWSSDWQPPYASAGTLSGKSWTLRLKGRTAQEIKENFTYTTANRNKVAPAFTGRHPLSAVRDAKGATALRIAQARDDQMVHHYRVEVTDESTGANAVSAKVLAEYYYAPLPNALDIPLPKAPAGTRYAAKVVAVDAYGNASKEVSLKFRSR
ncbi:metallophosphoesterase [Streptomyces sp. NPDC087440]|uniref:metallophosphoesterase n=1 Tax=Streptomyces sp. NPDC087440 TaxID=3365790 RepID=UPI00381EE9CF